MAELSDAQRAALERCEDCDLNERVARLEQIIFGDERLGFPGLKKSLDDLAKSVKQLLDDKERTKVLLIGIGIGLGVTGGASVLTLIKVAGLAVGVTTP